METNGFMMRNIFTLKTVRFQLLIELFGNLRILKLCPKNEVKF